MSRDGTDDTCFMHRLSLEKFEGESQVIREQEAVGQRPSVQVYVVTQHGPYEHCWPVRAHGAAPSPGATASSGPPR